jgi:hypothetical protein
LAASWWHVSRTRIYDCVASGCLKHLPTHCRKGGKMIACCCPKTREFSSQEQPGFLVACQLLNNFFQKLNNKKARTEPSEKADLPTGTYTTYVVYDTCWYSISCRDNESSPGAKVRPIRVKDQIGFYLHLDQDVQDATQERNNLTNLEHNNVLKQRRQNRLQLLDLAPMRSRRGLKRPVGQCLGNTSLRSIKQCC